MKTIKKLLALTLVLCMVFCLSVAVFADDGDGTGDSTTPTDATTVTVKKSYKLTNNGTSPAETFTLVQVGNGRVVDGDKTYTVPALGDITGAAYTADDGATTAGNVKNITINLPSYAKVGVYEYTLKEVVPSGETLPTAGVAYYGNEIYVVVTVVNDGTGSLRIASVHTEEKNSDGGFDYTKKTDEGKKDTFENTYTAATLKVSKEVTGNIGDKNKEFSFTVKFTNPTGKEMKSALTVSKNGAAATVLTLNENGEYTFTLKNGDNISFINLPKDMGYTITEENYTDSATIEANKLGYSMPTITVGENSTNNTLSYTGTIGESDVEVKYNNSKKGEIDMGVTLDSLPYILALAVVFGGAVVMVSRKRHVED